jgi:hypothetical protein
MFLLLLGLQCKAVVENKVRNKNFIYNWKSRNKLQCALANAG